MSNGRKCHENRDNLNANQVRALDALMRCPSVAAAADMAGLSERTLWRYLADARFSSALGERQGDVIRSTAAALVGLSSRAIEILRELLDDPDTPAGVRARVALGALDQARDTVELGALVERIAALESESAKR